MCTSRFIILNSSGVYHVASTCSFVKSSKCCTQRTVTEGANDNSLDFLRDDADDADDDCLPSTFLTPTVLAGDDGLNGGRGEQYEKSSVDDSGGMVVVKILFRGSLCW